IRMQRAILHVDMDAFYASVEQRDDPSLRGKPVAVGGPSRRGVVCAASYEARPFGVRSAMPMMRAMALCKDLIVVPPRFDKYAAVSAQVFDIFASFTPEIEGLSLDEAFLDVTHSQALFGPAAEQARKIKERIFAETQLTASVGVADVKFAAKIASDLKKPDALVVVPPGQVREFLAPLAAGKLWGVGPKTLELLHKLRLRTIGDVARAERKDLERALGSAGPWLHDLANGLDAREVESDRVAKSVGAEETFEDDLTDEADLKPFLHEQALRVAARLRRGKLFAGTVSLKVKYSDFQLASRQCALPRKTDDGALLYQTALTLLPALATGRPIRLTGLSASDLGDEAPQLGL
ncbi:MAG: DNA polymerase IV, partial [Deltaproteobacteria bacterium]|nr:DNA polymerase IV [Deltaproteobacteria bacterium]